MINKFDGRYRFLSSFWTAAVVFEDVLYPSSEHAYQAAKSKSSSVRLMIRQAPTPGKAKRLGRTIEIRKDWDAIKLDVMEQIVRDKFTRTQALGELLLATGDQELVEGNHWGDTFWSVCNGVGENHLGKILMKIRSELKVKGGMGNES